MNPAYKEALARIEACRKSGETSLDLRGMRLTSLPSEIGQLTALRELYLGGNQLTSLPPEIGQLTALRGLGEFRRFEREAKTSFSGVGFAVLGELGGNSVGVGVGDFMGAVD